MDIMSLGLNAGVIVAIVGLCEVVKKIIKVSWFKNFYALLPVVFSGVFALLMVESPFIWKNFFYILFIYLGVSSIGYNMILKNFKKKSETKR